MLLLQCLASWLDSLTSSRISRVQRYLSLSTRELGKESAMRKYRIEVPQVTLAVLHHELAPAGNALPHRAAGCSPAHKRRVYDNNTRRVHDVICREYSSTQL